MPNEWIQHEQAMLVGSRASAYDIDHWMSTSADTSPPSAILVLTEVFPPRHGGSGRWLWDLYRRLNGLDVAVLAGAAPGDRAFDQRSGLPTERFTTTFPSWGVLGTGALASYLRAARQARQATLTHRAAVLHCGRVLPEGLAALIAQRRTRVPFWCYAHGEELTLARTSRELRWLARLVFRRTARIVANSEHTRRLLIDEWQVGPDRIAVLTPGVDTSRFVPADRDEAIRGRQALGWSERRVVLTVGALQKRKGQDMMIRALPLIRRECPNVLYAMAGEGWEREYLEQLVAREGVEDCVTFLGVLNEDALLSAYQHCDLFALPNRRVGWDFEGFGIVLLEAQACGKPVIAGASGGTAETLIPGETGTLVGADDPAALASAVVALLKDSVRSREMGVKGRQWVVERFDWSVLTERARRLFTDRRESGRL